MTEEHSERVGDFDDNAFSEELRRLDAERLAHPGVIAKQRWDEVFRSVRIVQANIVELLIVLRAPNASADLAMELVQNVRPSPTRERYFLAVDQKLFNLIASVRALVDHRRKLVRKYEGTPFAAEFEVRNNALRDLPEGRFINAFRNYLEHYGVAPLTQQVKWERDVGFDSKMRVDSGALLGSNMDWKAHERESIKEIDPDGNGIDLDEVVSAYVAAFDELNSWWSAQFEELHGAEIDDANKIIERFNLHLSGGTIRNKGEWQDLMERVGENIATNQIFNEGPFPESGDEPPFNSPSP